MIWTVIFAAGLLLPSHEFSESKAAFPITHRLGQLGNKIVLYCNTSSSHVQWRLNGRTIEDSDDVYTDGSGRLTLAEAKTHQSGPYTCHHPHSNKILSRIELQLGLPPEKLQIQCWSSSYPEKINCTWDLQPYTNLPTTFIATYRLGFTGPDPPKKCAQHEMSPNSCLIRNFKMFEDFPYVLNVTALNALGSITQLYWFIAENIIRPDPPVNVTISSVCGESRKLYVQWQPPRSWPYPEIFPLKYKVRYRKAGAKSYTVVGPYEQTFLVLTGMRQGSVVHVQVAASDITDSGHSSDWSSVVTAHPWKLCFPSKSLSRYNRGLTARKYKY
ncbi:interleukin-27 subunit beta-like [Engystomops pustulosus]|uniref:interleukin-27 subunit beta-like n=1 Tax=Engystomops pustulosus TaxID=76066 RepID=UPI003AFA3423